MTMTGGEDTLLPNKTAIDISEEAIVSIPRMGQSRLVWGLMRTGKKVDKDPQRKGERNIYLTFSRSKVSTTSTERN